MVRALLRNRPRRLDAGPDQSVDVQGVQIVQVLAAVPAPEDVYRFALRYVVRRVHIARPRRRPLNRRLVPSQRLLSWRELVVAVLLRLLLLQRILLVLFFPIVIVIVKANVEDVHVGRS